MPTFNRSVGPSITLTSLKAINATFWQRIAQGVEVDMIPFLVTHEDKVVGIFVPANTSQAFLALARQVLPHLEIYSEFPAVQQLIGERDARGMPQDRQ